MKKKYLNFVLIILVLVIYGAIFFKHFGKKEAQLNDTPYTVPFSSQMADFTIKRNNFDINSIENDPFRINGKSYRPSVENSLPKSNTNSKPKKLVSNKPWPVITYYGFVKNTLSKTRLALIKVNSKLYRKREKEDIDDLFIAKVYEDSIQLNMNNEMKTIIKINE